MIQIISHEYGVEGVGISMQGGRMENQDDFGCVQTPLGFLIVVCDGMGGGPGGKTASYIAKTSILDTIAQCSEYVSPSDIIKMAVENANMALEEKMQQMPELSGMGSTLVILLITEQSAIVAHLGDSRCYQIRGKKVLFRTQDHSLVGELVSKGALSEEQARTSSQSNVITRGLGSTTNHVAEIVERPYHRGDRFILCTDGVWGIMPHEDLELRFANKQEVGSLAKNISAEVDQIGLAQGGHYDNHTLVIVELKKGSLKSEKMNKKDKVIIGITTFALVVSVMFNIISLFHFGAMPQLQALQLANDSLKNAAQILKGEAGEKDVEISRLLAQNDRLEQTLKYGDNVNQQVNTKLLLIIDSMGNKIDSLNTAIRQLQEDKAHLATSPSKKGSPKKLIDTCIAMLQEIVNMKCTTLQEATKKVKTNVDVCILLMEQLNEKTNNKYNKNLTPILEELRTSDILRVEKKAQSGRANNKKTDYVVQKGSKSKINTIIWNLSLVKKIIK